MARADTGATPCRISASSMFTRFVGCILSQQGKSKHCQIATESDALRRRQHGSKAVGKTRAVANAAFVSIAVRGQQRKAANRFGYVADVPSHHGMHEVVCHV